MTLQVIGLMFLPVLVVIDIWAIVIGSRGQTKVHIAARFAEVMQICVGCTTLRRPCWIQPRRRVEAIGTTR